MDAVWYAIGDFFMWLFPFIIAIGGYVNVIIALLIATGVFGWVFYMSKNMKDKGWNEGDKAKYFENY